MTAVSLNLLVVKKNASKRAKDVDDNSSAVVDVITAYFELLISVEKRKKKEISTAWMSDGMRDFCCCLHSNFFTSSGVMTVAFLKISLASIVF